MSTRPGFNAEFVARKNDRLSPDGQITSTLRVLSPSTPSRKNIPLRDYPKSAIQPQAFHPARGAYRDRHGRWGGMRWTRERCARGFFAGRAVNRLRERDQRAGRAMFLRTAKPCGPDTRCWCQVRWRFFASPDRARQTINPGATVTRRIRRRGERGVSRKATAQGEYWQKNLDKSMRCD